MKMGFIIYFLFLLFIQSSYGEITATTSPQVLTNPTGHPAIPTGCGKSFFQKGKVIGGEQAIKGAWPWQVMLKKYGKMHCGGTLISPWWVITAAHCIDETTYRAISVVLGEHNALVREETEIEIRASKLVPHPTWIRAKVTNDIGLIKLSSPAKFDNYVQPACLPSKPVGPGTTCYITGWGKTTFPGQASHLLMQGKLPVVSKLTCSKRNLKELRVPVTDAMLCAGLSGTKILGGCHGDSGGPFVCKDGERWFVHGAVSHGSEICDSRRAYTVFSKVTHFRDWIRENTNV